MASGESGGTSFFASGWPPVCHARFTIGEQAPRRSLGNSNVAPSLAGRDVHPFGIGASW